MDFNVEFDFVKKYIKKEYQERLMFELQSQKNRQKAISRFSHSSEAMVKDCFQKCNITELEKICELIDSKEKCYIISDDMNDGKTLLLHKGIEYFIATYMTMILISPKIVVVKEEFEKKEPLILISK